MAPDLGPQALNPLWPPSFQKLCQPPTPLPRVMTSARRWNKSFFNARVMIYIKNNNTWLFILYVCVQNYFDNEPDFYPGPL